MQSLKCFLFVFQKENMLAMVALIDEVSEAFAVVSGKISDYGKFHLVIHVFLQNIACKFGLQFEEIFGEVGFINQDFMSVIRVVHGGHQIESILNIVNNDVIAFDDGNLGAALLINSYIQFISPSAQLFFYNISQFHSESNDFLSVFTYSFEPFGRYGYSMIVIIYNNSPAIMGLFPMKLNFLWTSRRKRELFMDMKWLEWAKQIQAIAQTGITYAKDVYDIERYEELRRISIDILANYTWVSQEKIALTFASGTGYATPKVDIRGVVFKDNKILLVREKLDGAWAVPGGWGDIGFSPSEIAVKEIREESGFDVVPMRLLAVMDKKFHNHPPEPYHVYKMFIRCDIVGGHAETGVETSAVDFFTIDDLPELSLERNTAAQVKTMFEFLEHPDKEVILD